MKWQVQQAFTIETHPFKEGSEFWITQKLNGVRCTYYDGKLISRQGKEFKGLSHIAEAVMTMSEKMRPLVGECVFDGELTLKNKGDLSDNEAFRTATGVINSDAEEKPEIGFTVFDIVTKTEFDNNEFFNPYWIRRNVMNEFAKLPLPDCVSILPVLYYGTDSRKIDSLLQQMVDEDKEGLMVNLNVPYKKTRHKGILKVKRFYTMDLPIVRLEEGTGKASGMLGALFVDYDGNEVGVGTGYTDEERIALWKNRDNLIGKICEVKYKEISRDKKTGRASLQFPVFVRLRDDKAEESVY